MDAAISFLIIRKLLYICNMMKQYTYSDNKLIVHFPEEIEKYFLESSPYIYAPNGSVPSFYKFGESWYKKAEGEGNYEYVHLSVLPNYVKLAIVEEFTRTTKEMFLYEK